jgi:hypothetical protein
MRRLHRSIGQIAPGGPFRRCFNGVSVSATPRVRPDASFKRRGDRCIGQIAPCAHPGRCFADLSVMYAP